MDKHSFFLMVIIFQFVFQWHNVFRFQQRLLLSPQKSDSFPQETPKLEKKNEEKAIRSTVKMRNIDVNADGNQDQLQHGPYIWLKYIYQPKKNILNIKKIKKLFQKSF